MRFKPLLRLIPIAAFGTVLGHIFVYRHIFPDPTHMHGVLEQTGHSYFGVATVATSLLALLSLCAYGWLSYREKTSRRPTSEHIGFWRTFIVLSILQIVFFVFMELAERSLAHFSTEVFDFFSSSICTFGIIFQIATAAIVAAMVSGAVLVGSHVARYRVCACVVSRQAHSYDGVFCGVNYFWSLRIRPPPLACTHSHN